MKSERLSFFNPTNIEDVFSGDAVRDVVLDISSGVVTVVKFDRTEVNLPSINPSQLIHIESLQLENGVLSFFTNQGPVVVGDITSTYSYDQVSYVGTGLLVDNLTGLHKPIVGVGSNVSLVESETHFTFSATVSGNGDDLSSEGHYLDDARSVIVRRKISGVNGSVASIPSTAGWNILPITDIEGSGFSVSLNSGTLILPKGTYYADICFKMAADSNAKPTLRKVSTGEILLEGIGRSSSTLSFTWETSVRVSGYFTLTESTEVEIAVFNSLESQFTYGYYYFDQEFGLEQDALWGKFYRVSDNALLPGNAPQLELPDICNKIATMVEQYGERSPSHVKILDQIQLAGFNCIASHGGFVYVAGGRSQYILKWGIETSTAEWISLSAPWGFLLDQFNDAVVVGDKIYLIPSSGYSVAVLDTTTDSVSYLPIPGVTSVGSNKWSQAVYCPLTQKIYAAPYNVTTFLVIDVSMNQVTQTTFGLTIPSLAFGGLVYKNGLLYATPCNATNVAVINTITGEAATTTFGLTLTGSAKWQRAYYDPVSEKIVCVPDSSTDVLVIDTSNDTAIRTTFGLTLTGTGKWINAQGIADDGTIFIFPSGSLTTMLRINPRTSSGSITTLDWRIGTLSAGAFRNGVRVGNKIYLAGYNYTLGFCVYNLNDGTIRSLPYHLSPIAPGTLSKIRWGSVIRATNDVCYSPPNTESTTLVADPIRTRSFELPAPMRLTNATYLGGARSSDGVIYYCPFNGGPASRIFPAGPDGTLRKEAPRKNVLLTPVMTSNNQNGFIVTASSEFNARYAAFRAFDGLKPSTNTGWTTLGRAFDETNPHWIQIELPTPQRLDAFRYSTGYNHYLRKGRLLGSNDGITWVVLTKLFSTINTTMTLSREFSINDGTAYKFFRIEVFSTTSSIYANFGEIYLMQRDPNEPVTYNLLYDFSGGGDTPYQRIRASSTASGYPVNRVLSEEPPGNITDCWRSASTTGPHSIDLTFSVPRKCVGVSFYSATSLHVGHITVYGTNDGVNLIELLNTSVPVSGNSFDFLGPFYFQNENGYLSYRIDFIGAAGNQVSIAGLQLHTPDELDGENWWGRWEAYQHPDLSSLPGSYGDFITHPVDGKLYLIPISATSYPRFDPVTETFELNPFNIPAVSGSNRHFTGGLCPWTNKIFIPTRQSIYPDILIDPISGSFVSLRYPTELDIVQSGATNAAMAADGRLISAGNGIRSAFIGWDGFIGGMAVMPVTNLNILAASLGHLRMGPNGKLYGIPINGNILELDTKNNLGTFLTDIDGTSSNRYWDGVLLSNGMIYMSPAGGGAISAKTAAYALSFGEGISIDPDIINSLYLQ